MTRPADEATPLVAVCLATYEPPPALFERQLESIRAQTHGRFVCLISDDASGSDAWQRIVAAAGGDDRFVVSHSDTRLGFYRNFERCLALVPADAAYVAFADHDDRWHPDKLETLVATLESGGAKLAFSDSRVVASDGTALSETYWVDRRPEASDLATLLLSNAVPGAASVFRRELLDDVLPFPPEVGRPFHDHWVACVALALGEIAYVDRPLYDYVQHGGNALGHPAPSADLRGGVLHALLRLAASPRRRLTSTAAHAGLIYRDDVVRLQQLARTLESRLAGRMTPGRAAVVRRVGRLESPLSAAWLLARSLRDVRGRSATLGVENQLLKGIAWRYWHDARRRLARRRG